MAIKIAESALKGMVGRISGNRGIFLGLMSPMVCMAADSKHIILVHLQFHYAFQYTCLLLRLIRYKWSKEGPCTGSTATIRLMLV